MTHLSCWTMTHLLCWMMTHHYSLLRAKISMVSFITLANECRGSIRLMDSTLHVLSPILSTSIIERKDRSPVLIYQGNKNHLRQSPSRTTHPLYVLIGNSTVQMVYYFRCVCSLAASLAWLLRITRYDRCKST